MKMKTKDMTPLAQAIRKETAEEIIAMLDCELYNKKRLIDYFNNRGNKKTGYSMASDVVALAEFKGWVTEKYGIKENKQRSENV